MIRGVWKEADIVLSYMCHRYVKERRQLSVKRYSRNFLLLMVWFRVIMSKLNDSPNEKLP